MAWVCSTFDDVLPIPSISIKSKQSTKRKYSDLWVDCYSPSLVDELAVHKKKIQEVQSWISECLRVPKSRKIALLVGPPGSAKSTALRVICKQMSVEVSSWANPETQKFESADFSFDNPRMMNQRERFSDFVFRCSKYKSVCGGAEPESFRLLLVEEFPLTFFKNPKEFHDILRCYSAVGRSPLALVVSETGGSRSTMKTLLPADLLDSLAIVSISFNAISSSLLVNALTRVLSLHGAVENDHFESLGMSKKEFLQSAVEKSNGDIRSAINTLQFAIMQDESSKCLTKNAKVKRKKMKCEPQPNAVESLLSGKDSTLPLFRALGKVLYCKRLDDVESAPLPSFLSGHRRKGLLEDPEDVFSRSEADAAHFALFLHQNCLDFYHDVTDYYESVQHLQDADILDAFWEPNNHLKTYSSSISIRGMMHYINRNQPARASQRFRSLNSPFWYTVSKLSRERVDQIRALCPLASLSTEELVTVFVPLIVKIREFPPSYGEDLIKDIGLFYAPTVKPKLPVSHSSMLGWSAMQACSHAFDDDEDDIVIEEIDD